MNQRAKAHSNCIREIPSIPEGLLVTPLSGRELGSWIFRDGESCAAAKPSLVTFENSFLSPTVGGLDDVTGELPKAMTTWRWELINEFKLMKCKLKSQKKKGNATD